MNAMFPLAVPFGSMRDVERHSQSNHFFCSQIHARVANIYLVAMCSVYAAYQTVAIVFKAVTITAFRETLGRLPLGGGHYLADPLPDGTSFLYLVEQAHTVAQLFITCFYGTIAAVVDPRISRLCIRDYFIPVEVGSPHLPIPTSVLDDLSHVPKPVQKSRQGDVENPTPPSTPPRRRRTSISFTSSPLNHVSNGHCLRACCQNRTQEASDAVAAPVPTVPVEPVTTVPVEPVTTVPVEPVTPVAQDAPAIPAAPPAPVAPPPPPAAPPLPPPLPPSFSAAPLTKPVPNLPGRDNLLASIRSNNKKLRKVSERVLDAPPQEETGDLGSFLSQGLRDRFSSAYDSGNQDDKNTEVFSNDEWD